MAKSNVYFLNARSKTDKDSMAANKPLIGLEKLGFNHSLVNMKNVCIKTHFGALNNVRYLRPSYLRFLADEVKRLGGYPSVTESCGVGRPGVGGMYGGRTNEKEYLETALMHGFTEQTMGAPVYMIDGAVGTDYEVQKINGTHFKEVLVAGRLRESQILVSAAHFKGHVQTGFGGAIKNLGIGCVSKGGKGEAHSSKNMYILNEKITEENMKKCKRAIKRCPTGALKMIEDESGPKIIRNEELCRKCRLCHSYCSDVFTSDEQTQKQLIEHIVDNALGVKTFFESRNGKNSMFYVNYAVDIVQQCDCTAASDTPFVQDIGVLVSSDPVAVDQACVDLVNQSQPLQGSVLSDIKIPENAENKEIMSWIWPKKNENEELIANTNWKLQLETAEKMGLGSRQYNLITINIEPEEHKH